MADVEDAEKTAKGGEVMSYCVIVQNEFAQEVSEVYGPFSTKREAEEFAKQFQLRSLAYVLPLIAGGK
ncbi:MAG: hypothetical protein KGL39_20525 [Patescibacteria group bacterium]|nr:hypothetical protein [Patescibacteria group bacterium]